MATFGPHAVVTHGDPQLEVDQGVAGGVDASGGRPHLLGEQRLALPLLLLLLRHDSVTSSRLGGQEGLDQSQHWR